MVMIRDGAATNTIAFQSVFVIFENHMHHGGMHSLNSDIVVRLYAHKATTTLSNGYAIHTTH